MGQGMMTSGATGWKELGVPSSSPELGSREEGTWKRETEGLWFPRARGSAARRGPPEPREGEVMASL